MSVGMLAFPEDGFIAIEIPREHFADLPRAATGVLVRIKSSEGFKDFMVAAIEAAAQVWPDIAAQWEDMS